MLKNKVSIRGKTLINVYIKYMPFFSGENTRVSYVHKLKEFLFIALYWIILVRYLYLDMYVNCPVINCEC